MRIFNRAHVPWFIFVFLATVAAVVLYVANFHPQRMPAGIHLPVYLIQKPSEHRSVGGTPLGLIFGAISFAIFIFATLLGARKKVVLWRLGTLQRWMRAHIWLTLLTVPLVLLHSGFRLGGPMTTLLMVLYAVVMVSGIYGLILQHLMMERLPAETVFEQIPHIRSQLYAAAEKLRDSFRPTPPEKTDAGAPAPSPAKSVTASSTPMSSTAGDLSTPTARAKSTVGSTITAEPISITAGEVAGVKATEVAPLVVEVADPVVQKIQSSPAPMSVQPEVASAAPTAAKPAVPAVKPAPATAPKPATDPASEAALVEFIERQILPYLSARRGEKFQLNNPRFSDDTFRYAKLRVAEAYRSRVEEIQAWCDERRMLDLQTKLQHWLHAWLFVHVPFSFLLLMLTAWHAFVTLFYY